MRSSSVYWRGVRWIAANDEPLELSEEIVASSISVLLLSFLEGVVSKQVARDVVIVRGSMREDRR